MAQLATLGVSRQAVAKAVDAGLVCRVARGVVGVPVAWDTFEGRAMAAQLTTRRQGFLTGVTAARLYGVRRMPTSPIEVCLPEVQRSPVPSWVRLVKTSWPDDEVRPERDDGLIVASPLRTLFRLASQFTQNRFERAAEDAWHLGLVNPRQAADYLARIRRKGLAGVAHFDTWLAKSSTMTRPATTSLERLVVELCHRADLPEPVRQHPIVLPSGEVVHLDIAWPEVRFAVEPGHSWWHGGDLAQRSDQNRDRACLQVGWQVVRYDESVWEHQDDTVRELRELYRQRAAPRPS